MINETTKLEKVGCVLVLLMIMLQGFYGIFSYIEPIAFSGVRGTELFSIMDADWVKIYGSRTVFITLILAYLLYDRHYRILMWCALFGVVMPITDGVLAYEAQAPMSVVFKHIATVVYLLMTAFVLKIVIAKKISPNVQTDK